MDIIGEFWWTVKSHGPIARILVDSLGNSRGKKIYNPRLVMFNNKITIFLNHIESFYVHITRDPFDSNQGLESAECTVILNYSH